MKHIQHQDLQYSYSLSVYNIPHSSLTLWSFSGNRLLHITTSSRNYSLRIDMGDFEGQTSHAVYSQFTVGCEDDGFRLTTGYYSGTAGW